MAEDSVAQDQIKAFVDRILRLKSEVKEINADVREIYAEAKGNGFDKTVLGKLVNYVEKRQDNSAAVEESESIFDLYLTAYDSASGKVGTVRATHTHASEESREDRAKQRLSESMDDNKALSAEMAAAGLISQEAHAENIALSDAVAVKLGAGVIHTKKPQPLNQAGQTSNSDIAQPISNEAPMAVYGDSVEVATAPLSESVDILPGGIMAETLDGADQPPADQIPAAGKSVEAPASAAPAPMYAEPGVVTWENTPPEGVRRHDYSLAFGDLGQDIVVIADGIAGAKAEPIVKIGNEILDGWARYMTARGAIGLNGQSTEYPVVQYDGTDPLMDCIRWNVAGRILNDMQKRTVAQRLARLEPRRKADIYAEFELGMELA